MLRRLVSMLPLTATVGALVWALQSSPLAAPFVDRTATDLALTLERAVRREATADWLTAALAGAVAEGDADRAAMLIALADDLDRDVDTTAGTAMIDARTGAMSRMVDCAICMSDTARCSSLAHLTFCAVPFEMTVLGDLNALRRASVSYALDGQVDELEAGLALVGLAATGAVIFSGGSSVTVKAGATLLRMGRRIGSVTPALARSIRLPVQWSNVGDFVAGSARLEEVTDMAALARMGALASDMGRVRAATSTAEALRLARYVDTPQEAADWPAWPKPPARAPPAPSPSWARAGSFGRPCG